MVNSPKIWIAAKIDVKELMNFKVKIGLILLGKGICSKINLCHVGYLENDFF